MQALRAVIAALVLSICGAPPFAALAVAQGSPDAILKWDYQVLTKEQVLELGKKDLAAGLNKLGAEGWELAAVDGQYIFKRRSERVPLEEVQRQIALIEADVEFWHDRVNWAERMVKKGFMTQTHLDSEKAQLLQTEKALEAVRKSLKYQLPPPKESSDEKPKPK